MQRVRVVKSIGLIGLAAASLLLRSAGPLPPGADTISRQAGGRAAVGGAGEFSFHPAGRRTNRELEGRADLVGQQVQRPREAGAVSHL